LHESGRYSQCSREQEILVRGEEQLRCESCGSEKLSRLLSVPAGAYHVWFGIVRLGASWVLWLWLWLLSGLVAVSGRRIVTTGLNFEAVRICSAESLTPFSQPDYTAVVGNIS